mmetsp:Transcript_59875/g.118719  ORF Transcript_59875/g.118719 Transcript_59875/m.118719 type:complete len:562 (+) Transcript_59875:29-1714(+)|eukprot:CAMPEP_0172715006 /NCGR_PEP_ID=MMETSP1074-20121228/67296_1 /TAXON_ID=2916 /ORGANISM="Ceratium fusus, Strain PA161109" /LENGTH=561 /DNA_ID=CAMNT_0013539539 /DNA_START=26 /DNA_END=1711 /DNA_ORIENTATION=+
MTLFAMQMVSPSLHDAQSLQPPSLRVLVAVFAMVGTGSRPWGALAEVPLDSSSVEDKPCAPSCQGACFAGKCLFIGDESDSLGSLTHPDTEGVAAIHSNAHSAAPLVMQKSVPVEILQAAPVRNRGRLRRHGMGRAPAELRVTPPLAPMLAATPSNVAASDAAWHAGGQHGARQFREMHTPETEIHVGVQPHLAAAPSFASPHAEAPSPLLRRAVANAAAAPPQQQPALVAMPQIQQEGLTASERALDAKLKYEQQLEAALRAQNGQLHAELTRWREAGARVAEREAKVVETITELTRGMPGPKGEVPGQSANRTGAPRQSFLSTAVERYVFNGGKMPLEDSSNSRRLMIIFFAANALAFLLWVITARKGVGSRPRLLETMLRKAGLGTCTIEVSELQVRNVCICGEAHMSMRMGPETEVRIEATESVEGDIVKFEGVFTFTVHASRPEGTCVCWVMDRDPLSEEERIARLEVPMRDLLSLSQREHGEYVTFDLEPHGPQAKRWSSGARAAKPSLALRLRDVTMAPRHNNIMKSNPTSNCQVFMDASPASQRRLEEVAEPQ